MSILELWGSLTYQRRVKIHVFVVAKHIVNHVCLHEKTEISCALFSHIWGENLLRFVTQPIETFQYFLGVNRGSIQRFFLVNGGPFRHCRSFVSIFARQDFLHPANSLTKPFLNKIIVWIVSGWSTRSVRSPFLRRLPSYTLWHWFIFFGSPIFNLSFQRRYSSVKGRAGSNCRNCSIRSQFWTSLGCIHQIIMITIELDVLEIS